MYTKAVGGKGYLSKGNDELERLFYSYDKEIYNNTCVDIFPNLLVTTLYSHLLIIYRYIPNSLNLQNLFTLAVSLYIVYFHQTETCKTCKQNLKKK